jgi:hypothetical protein
MTNDRRKSFLYLKALGRVDSFTDFVRLRNRIVLSISIVPLQHKERPTAFAHLPNCMYS